MILNTTQSNEKNARRQGFTLIQILLVVGILSILSAILMGTFSRARVPANRAKCDVNLKQVVLAIDTFRQERGQMPRDLKTLLDDKYVGTETLRCPSDPKTSDPSHLSYADYYVLREPRDSGELPLIVCPFHEKDGAYGSQAYKGGYTKQFAARPASLAVGDFSGSVSISRPGVGGLSLPSNAAQPLQLRGGDLITVGAGEAKIRFQDGSTATVTSNTEMNVMQSFVEGQSSGTLYTLVRQISGKVNYYVNPGSNFEVSTATATAGALGTEFTIEVVGPGTTTEKTVLTVTKHTVAFTSEGRTIEVSDTDTDTTVGTKDPDIKEKERKPRKKSKDKD